MTIERTTIREGYSISNIIKGSWHLAGGHGSINERDAIADMRSFVEAGITTFDCADIYTGVEELIGKFLREHKDAISSGALSPVQVHTKYVPDYDALSSLTFSDTRKIIERSLMRLGVDQLDLVQFAWWSYEFPGYVETAMHLKRLQKEGKIRLIGVTNFDSVRLNEILDAGVSVATNQVQYSVLDHRPAHDVHANESDIPFLCYGSVAGGFLSDKYLGAPDPKSPLENRSLVKYRLIIDEFGGYEYFQKALRTLREIADKHQVDIAEVAIRYVLQREKVGAAIVGARSKAHIHKLQKISTFKLDADDLSAIKKLVDNSKGPSGPVYELERDKNGKHGSIMRYNLSDK